MLDVRRLRVLKEVAERGSFSAAAESLSYTQSAISQQIAALEREAGTTLVDRRPRGIRLTEAGRSLVEASEAILERLSAAEAELEAIADLRGGRLRLATFSTAGASIVPLAVKAFAQRHPDVRLTLAELEPEDSLPKIRSGEVDIAMTFEYSSLPSCWYDELTEDIEQTHLLDDPMHVALPGGHRLADRPTVRLKDLADEAWIQGDPEGICGAMHLTACNVAGFQPRVGFVSDDYTVVQGLVAAGVGVSLIPELALDNVRDDIAIVPLGRQAPVRRIYAASLTRGHRAPAVDAMLDVMREASQQYEAGRAERGAVAVA